MPLYLGHKTAELLLDALPVEKMSYSSINYLQDCRASRSDLSGLDLSLLEGIPQPYDVLVSSSNELRRWSGVRCHRCPDVLPQQSFIEIAEDVYVASPALCYVLQAQNLSLAQTMMLGMKFCGTFAIDKSSPSGLRERPPLLTPEDLLSYANRCFRVNGAKRARIAASYIIPCSASPMESATSLLLSLPSRLGGYGFKIPVLNAELPLSVTACRIAGKTFIRIDVFWPDFDFGLEYQGGFSHTAVADISNDIARQLAAEASGVTLQMVTSRQFLDPTQRQFLMQKIAQRIGEVIPSNEGFQRRNDALVLDLFT